MKPTGLKLICERSDGIMSTWLQSHFKTKVEYTINEIKHKKGWMNGRFKEAYIEFEISGRYYRTYLDVNPFNKLLIE